MDIISLVPSGQALLKMKAEDLAIPVLRSLNALDDMYRNRPRGEAIRFTYYCTQQAERYGDVPRVDCGLAIAAAFQHLINMGMVSPDPHFTNAGIFALTPKAKAIQSEEDYARYVYASRYPRDAIHPLIEKNTAGEYMSGDYETAVFKAFKTLEDLVRRRAGLSNQSIGVPLMREAFDKKDGRLTDKNEHEGEREALAHLMAGAIGRFKNPTSHRFTGLDDPVVAIEILQVASLLVRITEGRPANDSEPK